MSDFANFDNDEGRRNGGGNIRNKESSAPQFEQDFAISSVASSNANEIEASSNQGSDEGPPPPSSLPQSRSFNGTNPGVANATSSLGTPAGSAPPPRPPLSVSSSFAQLAYRTFETYMNEARAAEQFPPMEMLDDVCGEYGAMNGSARLRYGRLGWTPQIMQQPLEPVALRRHTHSTPLRHAPSIVDSSDDEDEPPPVGLEILNRSRSTPLSTSKNSAFGTILRTNSHTLWDGVSLSDRAIGSSPRIIGNSSSAFSLPPYPIAKANSRSAERDVARPVIFNPIKNHDDESEITKRKVLDGVEEMTSIEVQHKPFHGTGKSEQMEPKQKQTAASRAAKFLADVRNLRISTNNVKDGNDGAGSNTQKWSGGSSSRIQRSLGGRENPAKPPSVSSSESQKSSPADVSVADDTLSSKSSGNSSSTDKGTEMALKLASGQSSSDTTTLQNQSSISKTASNNKSVKSEIPKKQSIRRQQQQKTIGSRTAGTESGSHDSPLTVPSPVYHQLDDGEESSEKVTGLVCIHVNDHSENATLQSHSATRDPILQSRDSPDSTRYSATTSSSGQTSHSSRSGYVTQLSVISESDREVADLNNTTAGGKTDQIEMALSDHNVRFGDYVELADSPTSTSPSRDGAMLQADRFFVVNGIHSSKRDKRGLSRLRTLPHLNKRVGSAHSPTTVSSASVNTNSSSSSVGSEPPKIVSYFDRKQVSDLTSLHNRGDASSSPRSGMDDRELRDKSPSDQILVADSDVVFEGADAPKMGIARKPRPMWPGKGLQFGRKIRSLPPRSPHKGLRSSTTPPPGYAGSPTPFSIDNDTSTSTGSSKAYHVGVATEQGSQEVVRLSPSLGMSLSSYVMVPRGLSPIGGQAVLVGRGSPRMYEETSIEILKSNSKDDNSSFSSSPLPIISIDRNSASPCSSH
jgi:hypothetical protein